jgi:chemotaxis signal transduction protein
LNIESVQQTTAKGPAHHDGERSPGEGQAASSRVESISFSIGDEQYGVLSGLVTIEGTMIALVDLPNLLSEQPGEDAEPAAGSLPAAAA